jgi:hypothetical protein
MMHAEKCYTVLGRHGYEQKNYDFNFAGAPLIYAIITGINNQSSVNQAPAIYLI